MRSMKPLAVGNAELGKASCMIHRVIPILTYHFVCDISTGYLQFVLLLRRRLLTDLLAILQKSLARALFLYIFIHEVRSSGVRASITIVHIRKFYRM